MVRRESTCVAVFPIDLFAYFLGQCQKVGPGTGKLARSRQGAKKKKLLPSTYPHETTNLCSLMNGFPRQ